MTGASHRSDLRADILSAADMSSAFVDRWHDLAVASGNPFVLPEWHTAWAQAHPADAPFVLALSAPGGELHGVVPLVRRGRQLSAAGGPLADWFGPACAPADEARVAVAVVDALGRTEHRWDAWNLDRCKTAGVWIRELQRAAAGSEMKVFPAAHDDVLTFVDLVRDGPDLASGKKRRELTRLDRRLREAHGVTFRASTTPAQVADDLDALLRMRAAQWDTSFTAAQETFLHALAASLARRDLLQMSVLDVDGAPAAVLLGWRLGSRAFAYSTAFDRRHERFGIGMALLSHVVHAAADDGCTSYDFLRGDELYKGGFRITSEAVTSRRAVRRDSTARVEAEIAVRVRRWHQRLAPRHQERLRRARRAVRSPRRGASA